MKESFIQTTGMYLQALNTKPYYRLNTASPILMNSPEVAVPSSQSLLLRCASQSEAIRAGGEMEGLIHGTTSRIQLWAPHPQCSCNTPEKKYKKIKE